jgi:hypothetical protein
LFSICDKETPQQANLTYNFGLFESPGEYIVCLTGSTTYNKSPDHSVTRVEFEPANMYFNLPKREYAGLAQKQVRQQLTVQLEDFMKTKKFQHPFFQTAKSITTDWKGEIWARLTP